MSKAFVLMKAMPPTTGHLDLIRFADRLNMDSVHVVVDTADGEPMVQERIDALAEATHDLSERAWISIHHIENERENPEEPGFWDYWQGVMIGLGLMDGDVIVGSEVYCATLADKLGVEFVPYDPDRTINPVRATAVRNNPARWWDFILPEFRKHLQTRVTIFGAESTGKTTLVDALRWHRIKDLEEELEDDAFPDPTVLPEYARPYLENTVNEITTDSMTRIWKGQRALQQMPFLDHPLIIQDTDLYSTLGYWGYFTYHYEITGDPVYLKTRLPISGYPLDLRTDADRLKSDLYIITPSNIDFEPDPLRYGGDKREIDDNWWINFAAKNQLNFKVLDCKPHERPRVAAQMIKDVMDTKLKKIAYERPHQ